LACVIWWLPITIVVLMIEFINCNSTAVDLCCSCKIQMICELPLFGSSWVHPTINYQTCASASQQELSCGGPVNPMYCW
jgi:hypothetical protein